MGGSTVYVHRNAYSATVHACIGELGQRRDRLL